MPVTGVVSYATESGLGIQARMFVQHDVAQHILIAPHARYDDKSSEWYASGQVCRTYDELLRQCQRVIFMEGTFGLERPFSRARERGVRTVLITHYEFTPPMQEHPDVLVAPSYDDQQHFPDAVRLNIPVPAMQFRERSRAKVFVHNAGHGGVIGRNGTLLLLEAMRYVRTALRLIVRLQPKAHFDIDSVPANVDLRKGTCPWDELYTEGDVFVLPDRFGGSFLPMQEAFASGMPVMASDRENNRWLPQRYLLPTCGTERMHIRRWITAYNHDPSQVAQALDDVYDSDISEASSTGRAWGMANGWGALRGAYAAL